MLSVGAFDPLLASPIFKNRKWGRNNSVLGLKVCFQTNAPSPPPISTTENEGGTTTIWASRTVFKPTLLPLP